MQEIIRIRATMTTGKTYLFNSDKSNALYVKWQRDKEKLEDKEPCAILMQGFIVVLYDGKYQGSLQHVLSEHTEDAIIRDVVYDLRNFYKIEERRIAAVGHLVGRVDCCVRRKPSQWTKEELHDLFKDRDTPDYDEFIYKLTKSYENAIKGAQSVFELDKNQFLIDVLPNILRRYIS